MDRRVFLGSHLTFTWYPKIFMLKSVRSLLLPFFHRLSFYESNSSNCDVSHPYTTFFTHTISIVTPSYRFGGGTFPGS